MDSSVAGCVVAARAEQLDRCSGILNVRSDGRNTKRRTNKRNEQEAKHMVDTTGSPCPSSVRLTPSTCCGRHRPSPNPRHSDRYRSCLPHPAGCPRLHSTSSCESHSTSVQSIAIGVVESLLPQRIECVRAHKHTTLVNQLYIEQKFVREGAEIRKNQRVPICGSLRASVRGLGWR